ncbi:MAG TPA: glutathione S-transferase family protein [Polyangiaceae bacterium]
MGFFVEGKWTTQGTASDAHGHFVRESTQFHARVSADGSSGFPVEPGRYHLYVSLACPWAHRTILMRKLKGLEGAISMTVVEPLMLDDGWAFAAPDEVNGARFLREIYLKAKPDYTGRVTVPVLWDKKRATLVNNESREVLRMLDHEFAPLGSPSAPDFAPADLVDAIDREIDAMYDSVNNGVYRAGFATKQGAYEQAVRALFAALDGYEQRLRDSRFLLGPQLTEADVCLFTTLVRFEPVYQYHFKCNLRRLRDCPSLWRWVRDVYRQPGVADTVNLDHIKQHYYRSHRVLNPTGIVPVGPEIDYTEPVR